MSALNKSLLVDVGNSRIKICSLQDGRLSGIVCLADTKDIMSYLSGVSHVVVAAVGQADNLRKLKVLSLRLGLTFTQLESQKSACGVVNVYDKPASMGVDRWLAMLGARTLTQEAFAVLDFGTAITCDLVDRHGMHLGGWIAPGLNMMRASLLGNTERVFGRTEGWFTGHLGRSTADCVDSGCIAMANGMVKQAFVSLSRLTGGGKIFVCGGDANFVNEDAAAKMETNQHILFLGMAQAIGERVQEIGG